MHLFDQWDADDAEASHRRESYRELKAEVAKASTRGDLDSERMLRAQL